MFTFPSFSKPKRKHLPWIFLGLTAVAMIIVLSCITIYALTYIHYRSQIYTDIHQIPEKKVALVLGAGVWRNGSPSPILADRIQAAVELYKAGKVKKLLMSGDNRFSHYNEPEAMIREAINSGVPESDIQADYAGRRTYDSCWRAKNIFSQDEIIIVTQSFHMTRALFLCNQLGIKSIGFSADQPHYTSTQWLYWTSRDMVALNLSIIDLYLVEPDFIRGDKIDL